MTKMNWKEYKEMFNVFPEIGKWIQGKDNNDYRVIQVRLTDIVLEVKKRRE